MAALAAKTNSNPVGGDNLEFVHPDGTPCDALRMTKDCRPAEAGKATGAALTAKLATFCTTSASLFAYPIQKDVNGRALRAKQGAPNQQGYLPGLDYPMQNFAKDARNAAGRMFADAPPPKAGGGEETEMQKWYNQADANRDGRISRPEFEAFMTAYKGQKASLLQTFSEGFDELDINRDGDLTLKEITVFRTPALLQLSQKPAKMMKAAAPLRTANNRQYKASGQSLARAGTTRYTTFKVDAPSNAHISLFRKRLGTANIQRNRDAYEIVLGGWGNTRSAIRKNGGTRTRPNTAAILTPGQAKDFWVSYDEENGRVAAGTGTEFNRNTIMSWTDTQPLEIAAIGVMTGYGATGKWEFNDLPDSSAADEASYQANLDESARGKNWSGDLPTVQMAPQAAKAMAAAAKARGGAAAAYDVSNAPSVVNAPWLDPNNRQFGRIENSFQQRAAASKSKGAQYMNALVQEESGRSDGVTCLNGKYVWAKKKADGTRPIVSTVREAYNARGPNQAQGNWACRYMGVHCNTNNCNNQANTEVADTYVDSEGLANNEKGGTRRRRNTPAAGTAARGAGAAAAGGGAAAAADDDNRRRRRRRRRR